MTQSMMLMHAASDSAASTADAASASLGCIITESAWELAWDVADYICASSSLVLSVQHPEVAHMLHGGNVMRTHSSSNSSSGSKTSGESDNGVDAAAVEDESSQESSAALNVKEIITKLAQAAKECAELLPCSIAKVQSLRRDGDMLHACTQLAATAARLANALGSAAAY